MRSIHLRDVWVREREREKSVIHIKPQDDRVRIYIGDIRRVSMGAKGQRRPPPISSPPNKGSFVSPRPVVLAHTPASVHKPGPDSSSLTNDSSAENIIRENLSTTRSAAYFFGGASSRFVRFVPDRRAEVQPHPARPASQHAHC